MVQCPDTCTPGESFESGCNTCYCPESGKKNEAACTLMDCGCTTDDCQDGCEAYCSGTEVISPQSITVTRHRPMRNCLLRPRFFDCADLGQICEGENASMIIAAHQATPSRTAVTPALARVRETKQCRLYGMGVNVRPTMTVLLTRRRHVRWHHSRTWRLFDVRYREERLRLR